MEARYMTDLEWRICHAVNIYLYRNGRDGEAPILVHIPPAKKKNMRTVMNTIQERVRFPVGFAKYLYRMDGKRIRHPCELEMYNNYVVASNYDKYFKCAQYGRKRSPLIVLNRESKHIRVLRERNQNYYEWSMKKRALSDERPQFHFPTFYTHEDAQPQDLPVRQVGNLTGHLGHCDLPPQRPVGNPRNALPPPVEQPSFTQVQQPPAVAALPPAPPSYPPPPPNGYAVNRMMVKMDHSAQEALRAQQDISRFARDHIVDPSLTTANWVSAQPPYKHSKARKVKYGEFDINENVIADEEEGMRQIEAYSSDSDRFSVAESVLETDALGNKYQEMLRRYKKKLKRQALLEAQSSASSVAVGRCRNRLKPKFRPQKTFTAMSTPMTDDEEQIIVLPPPPLEFRDGIIPRGGTFYSYNPQL